MHHAKIPHVILSMKNYVNKSLKQFLWRKHKDTFGPTPFKPPEYGKKVQYVEEDASSKLDSKGIKKNPTSNWEITVQ